MRAGAFAAAIAGAALVAGASLALSQREAIASIAARASSPSSSAAVATALMALFAAAAVFASSLVTTLAVELTPWAGAAAGALTWLALTLPATGTDGLTAFVGAPGVVRVCSLAVNFALGWLGARAGLRLTRRKRAA